MRFGSLSFFCTKAYFKGGSLLQPPFSTPPKDGGHDRVYLGVRTCELFLAPTLPAKKKREKYACDASPAPKVIWENLNHASLRSMAVLVGRARTSGEAARKMKTKLLPPQSPLGFSALARLCYLARPTKTAMLRRLESCCVRERYWLVPSLIFFLKRLRTCLASSPRHWPPPCPSLSYTLRETAGIEPALSKHSVISRHK